jgi:two-component system, cell cycle sensor histidine kinase and response regulator CckA
MRTRATVLLAEDSEAVRRFVMALLNDAGYEILVAEDGEQALKLVESYQGTIQVLLSDVFMPVLNGDELARRILALQPEIKVILMSAHAPEMLAMDDSWQFIQKPFRSTVLLEKITRVAAQPS